LNLLINFNIEIKREVVLFRFNWGFTQVSYSVKSLTNKKNKKALYHLPHGVPLEKARTGKMT
jgi:hypothetical protein